MMKMILNAIALLFGISISYGDDPVQSFVNDLAKKKGANRWIVENQNAPSPKGGYVYRFELDVNGDGQKEMFVASSLDADKKGALWSVYRKIENGDYIKIKDSYFISSLMMEYVKNGSKRYSFYVPLRQAEGGSYFGFFWLDADGKWVDESRDLSESEQAIVEGSDSSVLGASGLPDWNKVALKLNFGTPIQIKIQKVLLAKLTQNIGSFWREVSNAFTLGQQYLDPEDSTDIASVATWQPSSSP